MTVLGSTLSGLQDFSSLKKGTLFLNIFLSSKASAEITPFPGRYEKFSKITSSLALPYRGRGNFLPISISSQHP
jgi:hypothetical protein